MATNTMEHSYIFCFMTITSKKKKKKKQGCCIVLVAIIVCVLFSTLPSLLLQFLQTDCNYYYCIIVDKQ